MSPEPINVAVLGCGRWGVHLIRNFLERPDVRLVAIADPNPSRLNAIAEQFTLSPETLSSTQWQSIFSLKNLNAVAIATPAATHYHLVNAALEHQCHVLVEKPLTLDPESATSLCRLAARQQRQLIVDHTYLFHPAVQRGKQLFEQRSLGQLRYGYASRTHLGPVRQDVDALWDLAIHDISIFNYWLNSRPMKARAWGTVWLQPQSNQPALFPVGLSDLVWVNLIYPNNVQVVIHLCWVNPDKQRRLTVVGSDAALVFDELAAIAPLTLQQGHLVNAEQRFTPVNQNHQAIDVDPLEPLQQVCNHFLDCICFNTPSSISSGWTAVELIQILSALTQSLNQGGLVVPIEYSDRPSR